MPNIPTNEYIITISYIRECVTERKILHGHEDTHKCTEQLVHYENIQTLIIESVVH